MTAVTALLDHLFNSGRVYFFMALFVLLSLAMGGRVLYLNAVQSEFLQGQGDARTVRLERINAHRGMITDRHGKPLAISSPVSSIWANPKELLAADDFTALALTFGVSPVEFEARLRRNANRDFIYLRRLMAPPEAQKVLELEMPGVYEQREYRRFYPTGEVAAHLVGFTNIDDRGQEGVELSFDEWLRGEPGQKKVLRNLYGQTVRDIRPVKEAKPGKSLALSVDLRLQYLAYRELKSAVASHRAESGSIVILDVRSGEVLAMVNQPSYNPNNRNNLDLAAVRNRAATDVFEPGSTVKPLTAAVAMESGAFYADSMIDTDPGFIHVDGKTIPDPVNYGELTLADVIAKSSQVGITKVALALDEFEVWEMFRRVGFGEATGIGFPGESNGYLPNHRRWKDIERATFAYGYGLTVTPLQLAKAYTTLARGGDRVDVSIMKNSDSVSERVMTPQTAAEIREMLSSVTETGTGSRATVEGYSVAGKTGTVRKVGESGYEDTRHLAFFAGMAPVDDPRIVAVVMVNDPKEGEYGGGAVAAPVFARVVSGALRLLNVPPDNPAGLVR